jgi:hypothetical protein
VALSQASKVEDDDLVPICAGGDNSAPGNHWPQPLFEAREKDALEGEACRDICLHGASPTWWQGQFRAEWRRLYATVFHRPPAMDAGK